MNLPSTVPGRSPGLLPDPLWYKDAVIYELRVPSFNDSNADGIGDIKGLTKKLDYLQDLGITALWLLPICPSPGRDDGYDISDYMDVAPDLGTIDDFKELLEQAHRRGLRVITELVLNHTSDKHPWFQRAKRAPPGSALRDFYVWSDTPEKYKDARIIFKDFEPSNWSWDPVARAYFWHRFYAHQPDLNFESPDVRQALMEVVDFWFSLGVDGLRLDAVPYLYEAEGTNCENLPATHAFLRELRQHIDGKFADRMLLAEANQWPEDAAAYFGEGRECHMNFHFPIMPRLFMSIHMEDRFPILDILAQTPTLPESCQWALFLRNHDELTLEMVTDEERDYMYRAYAHDTTMRINLGIRRRLAPLVGNDRSKIELMNALLCSLPGTPVLYYGDEVGMGDNIYLGDRNGVRTPMQWSADRNAGFSRANPQKLILPVIIDPEYHFESLNVEAQQNNTNSLLWWTKRLLALRHRHQAFGRGTIEFLHPDNPRVLAFTRRLGDETILVVANLSRFVQYVELDLSQHKGATPLELFGRTEFPRVGDLPYLLTLSGHGFYWFSLPTPREGVDEAREAAYQPPTIELSGNTDLRGDDRSRIESILPRYLRGRRWFEGRSRDLVKVRITESFPLPTDSACSINLVQAVFSEGAPETYVLPTIMAWDGPADEIRQRAPASIIAQLRPRDRSDATPGVLADALVDGGRCQAILAAMSQQLRLRGTNGAIIASRQEPIALTVPDGRPLEARAVKGEHHKATLVYDEASLLKVFRRLDDGPSSELEIGRFLVGRCSSVAAFKGALEYAPHRGEPVTLMTLHGYVPNEGTAWKHICQQLGRFYERVLTGHGEDIPLGALRGSTVELALSSLPENIATVIGSAAEAGRLLGVRLAELHVALASDRNDPLFAPMPYTTFDQRSSYQSMRNLVGLVLRSLHQTLPRLEGKLADEVRAVTSRSSLVYERLEALLHRRLTAFRIRVHGDYHLRKVLYTGKDFTIIDFEHDRGRPLTDRRRRQSAVRDLASMIHSFDAAASTVLMDPAVVREADQPVAERWASFWQRAISISFLQGYLEKADNAPFVPQTREELTLRLETFLLGRVFEEIGDELPRRTPRLSHLLRSAVMLIDRAYER